MRTAIRVSGEPGKKGGFEIASASEPGLAWAVELVPPDLVWCACPRFARAGACRHSEAALAAFRQEARGILAAERADPVRVAESRRRVNAVREVFDR